MACFKESVTHTLSRNLSRNLPFSPLGNNFYWGWPYTQDIECVIFWSRIPKRRNQILLHKNTRLLVGFRFILFCHKETVIILPLQIVSFCKREREPGSFSNGAPKNMIPLLIKLHFSVPHSFNKRWIIIRGPWKGKPKDRR